MKIVKINNYHLKPFIREQKYRCTCINCGTVFIFTKSEASVPRFPDYKPEHCTIKCPNCLNVMTLKECEELNQKDEKNEVMKLYSRQGGI